tara:strand:+ start:45773 stop:47098 length:1326 start_codon:yes stop_codon:yes gene_type:complete
MINDYRNACVEILFQTEFRNLQLNYVRHKFFLKSNLKTSIKSRISVLTDQVTRLRIRLDHVIKHTSGKKKEQIELRFMSILRIAVYEILFDCRVPNYAAVSSAVDLSKHFFNKKSAGFANAVLRKIIRHVESNPRWIKDLSLDKEWHSLPNWILDRWLNRFDSNDFKNLTSLINSRPSTHIRFDANRISKKEVIYNLSKINIITEISGTLDNFLKVKTGISRLLSCQLFSNGLISIQDPAAGGCVELLNPKQGEIILDVCASPGTKTLMIAEKIKGNGLILASDISLERVKHGRKDVSRHGFTNIKWIKQNAKSDKFQMADKILVDAPCTGTGVLARRPDIRWRRKKEDVGKFSKIQIDILNNISKYLKIGGELVFSTCSIEPEENWGVIENFLSSNSNFNLLPSNSSLPKDWVNNNGCLETLPHINGVDGMFAAKIIRND